MNAYRYVRTYEHVEVFICKYTYTHTHIYIYTYIYIFYDHTKTLHIDCWARLG